MTNKIAFEKAFGIAAALLGEESDAVFTVQVHGHRGSVTIPAEVSLIDLNPGMVEKVDISDRQTKIHFTV